MKEYIRRFRHGSVRQRIGGGRKMRVHRYLCTYCKINWQMQARNFEIPCQTSIEIDFDLVKTNQSFGWNFEGKSRSSIPKKSWKSNPHMECALHLSLFLPLTPTSTPPYTNSNSLSDPKEHTKDNNDTRGRS